MTTLTEEEGRFLRNLSPEKYRNYWALHGYDRECKKIFSAADLDWNRDTDSNAVSYIRKLMFLENNSGRRDGARGGFYSRYKDTGGGGDTEEDETEEDSDSLCTEGLQVRGSKTVIKKGGGEVRIGGESSSMITFPGLEYVKVRKFSKESFTRAETVNEGGLFRYTRKGYMTDIRKRVIVKEFHEPLTDIAKKIEIIKRMYRLGHRNVVALLGMIDTQVNQCPQLVYDYQEGDINLLDFLRGKDDEFPKDYNTFGKLSLDIIIACEYLHQHCLVHGNLAARSVVVQKATNKYKNQQVKTHFNAKIADYGIILLTDGEGQEFYKTSNGKVVPLRWVPKEILQFSDYKPESDVWSFGVLLWEMWTHGELPYGVLASNSDVQDHILNDRHPLTFLVPKGCRTHIRVVMENIFMEASKRPTMTELREKFEEFRDYQRQSQQTQRLGKTTLSNGIRGEEVCAFDRVPGSRNGSVSRYSNAVNGAHSVLNKSHRGRGNENYNSALTSTAWNPRPNGIGNGIPTFQTNPFNVLPCSSSTIPRNRSSHGEVANNGQSFRNKKIMPHEASAASMQQPIQPIPSVPPAKTSKKSRNSKKKTVA